ncbi:hypothetical protein IL306_014867 [Fusarium sp. DS 682]|nr:hypothetical protein IL306_014867 [Fusarium sp. DS 682]
MSLLGAIDMWDRFKDEIKTLYLTKNLPLEGPGGVIEVMSRRFGFDASKAQYEYRLKNWGFRKYVKGARPKDWQIARRKFEAAKARLASTGKEPQIYYRGKPVAPKVLDRRGHTTYLQQRALEEEIQTPNQVQPLSDLLKRSIPERYDNELALITGGIFENGSQNNWIQVFRLVAYFSSNNLLLPCDTDKFLGHIVDHGMIEQLEQFLAINIPTTHAFATRLLESGIRIKNITFLSSLLSRGVKFESHIERIFEIGNSAFINRVISKMRPGSLDGPRGGKLLQRAANLGYMEAAQNLIENGADVNYVGNDPWMTLTTPLFQAVESQNFDMVLYLLKSGADPNKQLNRREKRKEGDCVRRDTALGAAVKKGNIDITTALLDHGAKVSCKIGDKDILEWTWLNSETIHRLLLERARAQGLRETVSSIQDLMDEAARGIQSFQNYLQTQAGPFSDSQLEQALDNSVRMSKTHTVTALLQHGVDSNCPTLKHRPLETALKLRGNYSIKKDRLRICQLLLLFHADVNIPGILSLAVSTEHLDLLKLFTSHGTVSTVLAQQGSTALLKAVETNLVREAAHLIESGVDVNTPGVPFTPIQWAAALGNIGMVEYLLSKGADIHAPANLLEGRTALQAAIENAYGGDDNFQVAHFLLDKGAHVDAPPADIDGITALEAASAGWIGKEPVVKLCNRLLEAGAPVNRPSGQPSLLLHNLIQGGQPWLGILTRVLEAGAIVNHMSYYEELEEQANRTPLQLAAELGQLETVQLLVAYGAVINEAAGHEFGRTALQAAISGHAIHADEGRVPNIELVEYLLEQGADINAAPAICGGITALQGAAIQGDITIARLLLLKGADVNASPAFKEGRSAIEGAAEYGRLDMVQFLLNAGADGGMHGQRFETAIQLANSNSHFAVANLLRNAKDNILTMPVLF